MNKRTEHFNTLKSRLDELGKAVFGVGFSYEVTVPAEDTHCDATVTLDHVISISVYEPESTERDAPIYYWGMVSTNHGNREEPPSEDFTELGNARNTVSGLDSMVAAIFRQLVDVRIGNKLDADADAAADAFNNEDPS